MMSAVLQRIWEGPQVVGQVDIGGGPLDVSVLSPAYSTLQDVAAAFELGLETATGVGWTVVLSNVYVLVFYRDSAASFDWTQAGGFGDFWGAADGVGVNIVFGTEWTAALYTRYTIEVGLPILVLRRIVTTVPAGLLGSSVLDSHLERDVSIRLHTADGDDIISVAQDGPWIWYNGDNVAWSPGNLDGWLALRPIQNQLQQPQAVSPRSGAFMAHNMRCVDILTEVF